MLVCLLPGCHECFVCDMSAASSDREEPVEDQIRLVTINASELLKRSSTARKVFGADLLENVGNASSATPVLKGSSDDISETVTSSSESTSTVSVRVERVLQEHRFRYVCLNSSDQSPSSPRSSSSSPAQAAVPNDAVRSRQIHTDTEGDICDALVASQPASAMHTVPSACASLPAKNSVTEKLELPKINFQLDSHDMVAGSSSQMMASDKLNTDDVIASNNSCKPSCQPVESEFGAENGQQSSAVQNSRVLRNDMGKSISRKPCRIVSFTTEDFDLFQSKYVVACNLAVIDILLEKKTISISVIIQLLVSSEFQLLFV